MKQHSEDEYLVRMLRSIQPTAALPVTRNMPYTTASVPSRNQPRNMTGIYLGLEGNIKPPTNRGGFPVPMRSRAGMSQRIRTPAEDRRYKMVELLRIKEEKRGFKGQPVKNPTNRQRAQTTNPISAQERRRQQQLLEESEEFQSPRAQTSRPRHWGPARSANRNEFNDIIRSNPRNYTVVINSGVTRSENLTGLMSFKDGHISDYEEVETVPFTETLVEEVHRITNSREDLTGLEECYKKVCKGNMESLQSLLPLRRGQTRDNFMTGFTVRSYRNPNKAEIMAEFDPSPVIGSRPKTVPAQRQPLVPAPYFFRFYNKPGTATNLKTRKSASGQLEGQFESGSVNGAKIMSSPGTGGISRTLNKNRNSAWSENDFGGRLRRGTPRTSVNGESPIKDVDSRIGTGRGGSNAHLDKEPLEIRAEGYATHSEPQITDQAEGETEAPPTTNRSDLSTGREEREAIESSAKGQASRIMNDSDGRLRAEESPDRGDNTIKLAIENEEGKTTEIQIDKEVTNGTDNLERYKASEAKIASMKEDAKQRKKDFEQILDEHAEIVTQITQQVTDDSPQPTDGRDQ